MNGTITVSTTYGYDPRPLIDAIDAQNVTQRQLAKERGIHHVHLCKVLARATSPSLTLLQWLCERLGVPESDVITGPE